MNPAIPLHVRAREGERGVALILGFFFTIIVVGITVAGSLVLKAHQTKTKTNFVTHGQAVQFARSGLIEAIGWLRKQTSQPVTNFSPVLDTVSVPPILDTLDPDIGIVREFSINGAFWGRYEVWKDWPADPIPARLAWRNQMRSEDVSTVRGYTAPGSVWRMRSIGFVFRRVDPAFAYNELPNQVLGTEILEVEARRLALMPPGQAAVNVGDGNSCHINTKGRIIGGGVGAGIYYPQGTGTPTVGPLAENRVTGTPPLAQSLTYDDSIQAVFGVSLPELRAMADFYVTNANDFPSPVPANSIVVAELASINFDAARPLSGLGVVVIIGNVMVSPGSNSSFSGLLYIDGNFTFRDPAEIQGSVVCTGNMTVQGASDFATISYDDGILNALRQQIGSYRLSSTVARPLSDGR